MPGEQPFPPGHSPHEKQPPASSPRVARIHPWRVALIAAGVILAVFALGYIPRRKERKVVEAVALSQAASIPHANVTRAKRAPRTSTLQLPGAITPLTEAYIYARATGYVRRRYADIGDHVRQGQLLADVEAPDLDAQVAQARAMLAQAQQQLAQTKATLENANAQEELARLTWQRYQVLVSHGAVSQQDADQQVATYRTALANVHLQEAAINTAQENVRASNANLERQVALQEFEHVRAPFSGVVTARNFDVGAYINGGGNASGASAMPGGGTQATGQFGNAGGTGGFSPTGSAATGAGGSGGELFRMAQIGTLRILVNVDRKSTRLNSSHSDRSRMPSSA